LFVVFVGNGYPKVETNEFIDKIIVFNSEMLFFFARSFATALCYLDVIDAVHQPLCQGNLFLQYEMTESVTDSRPQSFQRPKFE